VQFRQQHGARGNERGEHGHRERERGARLHAPAEHHHQQQERTAAGAQRHAVLAEQGRSAQNRGKSRAETERKPDRAGAHHVVVQRDRGGDQPP
jgi:hypothetical protein